MQAWLARFGRPCSAGRDDHGAVTSFVVVFSIALIFVTGLLLDGGRILTSNREARNVAQSAARAGAQHLDDAAVRNNEDEVLDEDAALIAACDLLAEDQADHPCGSESTVTFEENEVIVTVTHTVDMVMIPGLAPRTFTVEGRACVARGITEAPPC